MLNILTYTDFDKLYPYFRFSPATMCRGRFVPHCALATYSLSYGKDKNSRYFIIFDDQSWIDWSSQPYHV